MSAPVVTVVGSLDLSTVQYWETRVLEAGSEQRALILDLTDVGFLDSAGMHTLFRMLAAMHRRGTALVVVAPQHGRVHRLLEILDLPSRAAVCETLDDARAVAALEPHDLSI